MLIRVALPVPLYREFDYLVPNDSKTNITSDKDSSLLHDQNHPNANLESDQLHDNKSTESLEHHKLMLNTLPPVGSRVQVPFGRQTLIGIVVEHITDADSKVAQNKLKAIKSVLDSTPILNKEMLSLARWLAQYYHYPLGDVLSVMLPTLIRQGKPIDMLISHWRVKPNVSDTDFTSNAHKQKQQFAMLKLHGNKGANEDTLLLEGMQRPFLKRLEKKGLVEHYLEPKPAPKPVTLAKLPLQPNDQQQHAINSILQSSKANKYNGFLLNGVTGSGKTEVYLQAMQPILEAGKQVLVLVPEIGLTPQTRSRFANRFSANILLLHSGLNNTQRMHGWEDCRQGRAQIIIGTRSTVLHSFANLGLIVVDEAHDQSYKQQDTLRYHATDVALYRGYHANIPVVLGTATPSLEHFKLVKDGKLTELKLTKRAGLATAATFQLIDARISKKQYAELPLTETANTKQQDLLPNLQNEQNTGLTEHTIRSIRNRLDAGEQVLVFLNRRGYAPILLCSACGWQACCNRCDARLTLHHSQLNKHAPSYLKCHHCDWQSSIPLACPDCGSNNLDPVGLGTTRLTESLHAIFANPQTSKKVYPIIQIDRDTTRNKDSWDGIYSRINSGEPAILVGTQMIAKGHHFPNVTLVCMPTADRGFLSADFRSPEHTAQLIVQVAGRSGRGNKPGSVLIQTLQPENPLLLKLVRDGYEAFALALLKERKLLALPPYTYAVLIRCEGKSIERTTNALNDALKILPQNELAILGPIDAPMAKKNSRYHSQLLLLSKQRTHLHQVLDYWWPQVLALPSAKYLKLSLDVDPINW